MPASPSSRFGDLPILSVTAPDGSQRNVVALRLETQALVHLTTYSVREGDAIDLLAARMYGDEGLWWRLLDGNAIRYPLDLTAGDLLDVAGSAQVTATTRARTF